MGLESGTYWNDTEDGAADTSGGGLLVGGLLGGIAIGALAMYLADPAQGRRRRARAQDKVQSMGHRTGTAVSSSMRDASNRLAGLRARAMRLMGQRDYKPIDDHVLEARVRSRMGRAIAATHPIRVVAQQGRVTLSGPILTAERQRLVELVRAIPGVEELRDNLELHDRPDIPGLQGALQRFRRSAGGGENTWNPAQLAALVGGGLLGLYGLSRRSPGGLALAAAGVGLLANSARTVDLRSVLGVATGARRYTLNRTIRIDAAPETVFDVWSNYENFPHFMSHVVEVRDLGNNRSHWVVKGPAGTDLSWNAVLTRVERPRVLAWHSEPGGMVDHEGSVHLETVGGGTLVTIRMSWVPPAGALGQGLAMLLGGDPERELADDLQRMKNFIERGVPQHDTTPPATTTGQILH